PFRRVAELSHTMERFSAGDLDARAPEVGPSEIMAMARTFNSTAESLVRARQRQSEYVTNVLHDLRTPLTAIKLALGYIEPGRPLPPEPCIRELVALIERQLVRINGVVGDVLGATWIEAGELPLLRESVDLRAIASVCVQRFRELAPEHVIDLDMPSSPM